MTQEHSSATDALIEEMINAETLEDRRIHIARMVQPLLYALVIHGGRRGKFQVRRTTHWAEGITDDGEMGEVPVSSHAQVVQSRELTRFGRFKVKRVSEHEFVFMESRADGVWKSYLQHIPSVPWWLRAWTVGRVYVNGAMDGENHHLWFNPKTKDPLRLIKKWNDGEPKVSSFLWLRWLTFEVEYAILFDCAHHSA